MEINFDELIDRSGTHSEKWDRKNMEEKFGNPDAIPMWVADMDFRTAPAVVEAVTQRAAHGIYGYSARDDAYYQAVVGWQKTRHRWEIQKDWVTHCPGVVPAVAYAIMAFTQPGDEILIQEPVYYPFRKTIESLGRTTVVNPLRLENGRYGMDLADLEKKAARPKMKMLILCSPHNPVGRVWTPEELARLGDICVAHDLLVLADEIHNDLIMPGFTHTVFASLKPEFARRSITCTAPSKTFNLAGMQDSCIIISDETLREKYRTLLAQLHLNGQNPFSLVATTTAYAQCGDWVDQMIAYIAGNYRTLVDGLSRLLPRAIITPLEGTYLAWVDFSAYLSGSEPPEVEVGRKAGVAFDGGDWFGEGGAGHLRVNLACPRSLVERAVAQLGEAFGAPSSR